MADYWQTIFIWLAPWKFCIDIGAALSAATAAVLWLCASRVRMPGAGMEFVHPYFERALLGTARRQNRLNSWAAGVSGLAVLLTALGTTTTTFWHP